MNKVKGQPPWRVGRKVGRTVYDAHDNLLGIMDTPELAAYVVHAVNQSAPRTHTSEGSGISTVTTAFYACIIPGHNHNYRECPNLEEK